MKKQNLAWITLGLIHFGADAVRAQVDRYDMGPQGQVVASGFQSVVPSTLMSDPLAPGTQFGWASPGDSPSESFDRTPQLDPVELQLPPPYVPLTMDGDFGYDGVSTTTTLLPDPPNKLHFQAEVSRMPADYRVVLYLGDPLQNLIPDPLIMDVTVEGVPVKAVRCRTSTQKASLVNPLGGYRRIHLRTTVSDGVLDVLVEPGADGADTGLLAVEIYPELPEPIRFTPGIGLEKHPSASAGALDDFLTEMNSSSPDYALARVHALAIVDDIERGYAAAWLAGWLTGGEQDMDTALLSDARTAVEGLPDNVLAAVLLAEIKDMELGLAYNEARGYSNDIVPLSLPSPFDPFHSTAGAMSANLGAAALLFEQQQSGVLNCDPLDFPCGQPQSPLFLKAQYLLARNFFSRNTKNGPGAFTSIWHGIIDDLYSLHETEGVFPAAHELAMFNHLVDNYSGEDGIFKLWDPTEDLSGLYSDLEDTWWSDVLLEEDPNAPAWANSMRQYYTAYRSVADWWTENNLLEDEFGGGAGDDVEGGALLAIPNMIVREPENSGAAGASLVLDTALFSSPVNVTEGYYDGNCADVQHTAEHTTNPLFMLIAMNSGDPRYLTFANRTMRNFADDTNPWSSPVGLNRQFNNWHFTATDSCTQLTDMEDVPMNIRAIVPGFNVIDHNGDDHAVTLLDELCRGWIDHLLSNAEGKPTGVFPASVDHSGSFQDGGAWWKTTFANVSGKFDYTLQLLPNPKNHNQDYLYSLARLMQAHHPTDPFYLLPALEGARFLADHLVPPVGTPMEGTDEWTAQILGGVIANAIADVRHLLDPATITALGGDPVVDGQKLDDAVETFATSWHKFLVDPAHDRAELAVDLANAAKWIRYFYPLATTTVNYVDRIAAFTGANDSQAALSHQLLLQTMLGGQFSLVPSFPVSWVNTFPLGGELDVAILVLEVGDGSLDALIYNFGTSNASLGMQLWRKLPFGDYDIDLGTAKSDDTIDTNDPVQTLNGVALHRPGSLVPLSVPPGTLQKLEVRLQGAPLVLPELEDLAVGIDDISYDASNGELVIKVHNLGRKVSVPATVDVHAIRQRPRGGGLQITIVAQGASVPPVNGTDKFVVSHTEIRLPFTPIPGATIKVQLFAGADEITSSNNSVEVGQGS